MVSFKASLKTRLSNFKTRQGYTDLESRGTVQIQYGGERTLVGLVH